MNDIEVMIRIMIAYAYYYGNTTKLEFNEKQVNEVVPKLNALFNKFGYKTDIFLKDKNTLTYKNYIDMMLSIFGDVIYNDDRPFNNNWFGLYDEEGKCLDIVHLSYSDAEKWVTLANYYNQDLIETGSYILTKDLEVFKSTRDKLENNYKKNFII